MASGFMSLEAHLESSSIDRHYESNLNVKEPFVGFQSYLKIVEYLKGTFDCECIPHLTKVEIYIGSAPQASGFNV